VKAGKIILIIFGAIFLLAAIGMLLGGGALMWVDQVVKDSEGFISTDTIHLERVSYAIITHQAEINLEAGWNWGCTDLGTIRVEGASDNPLKEIFIGIADEADVEDYLHGVEYDEISEFKIFPYEIHYRSHHGTLSPAAPTTETFWSASVHGTGTQSLEWEVESGTWVLVLMNADGAAGVNLSGSVGIKAPWMFWLSVGLLIGGVVALIIAGVLIYFATRRPRAGAAGAAGGEAPKAAPPEAQVPHPFTIKGELTEPLSQWLWLVKWLLLIPHYIVLVFLLIAFIVVWLVSLFAILFTGKYPRDLFDFNVGVMRWTWRVGFYGYQALGTDKYPPFTLKAGGYPADLDVQYPERLNRGLVLVKWWLLAIPHYILFVLFWGIGPAWGVWLGLCFLLVLFSAIVLLFTGRYPGDIFNLVMGINRWTYRVISYSALMTDRYPPFRLGD